VKDLEKELDEILHPERNGVLIKEGIAEGASFEHLIKKRLLALIKEETRLAMEQEHYWIFDKFGDVDELPLREFEKIQHEANHRLKALTQEGGKNE